MKEIGIKNFDEVAHLLHALNFEEISKIMDDEVYSFLISCWIYRNVSANIV